MSQRAELVNRRKKLGLTHSEVAEMSSISRAYYTNIEAGRKSPSMAVAKNIADTLKTKIDRIFFERNVPKGNENKSA
jgi:DNA-binding XRE family transcriptional regulator